MDMTNRPPSPGAGEDLDAGLDGDHQQTSGAPRWVKVFVIIALALAMLFVGLKVTGLGGDHGPGRHGRSGTAPSGVTEGGSHASTPGMNHG
jgi:hypothetical protein